MTCFTPLYLSLEYYADVINTSSKLTIVVQIRWSATFSPECNTGDYTIVIHLLFTLPLVSSPYAVFRTNPPDFKNAVNWNDWSTFSMIYKFYKADQVSDTSCVSDFVCFLYKFQVSKVSMFSECLHLYFFKCSLSFQSSISSPSLLGRLGMRLWKECGCSLFCVTTSCECFRLRWV